MIEPKPLQTFIDILLKSKAIKKLVTEHYGPDAKQQMKQFQAGEVGDLLALVEESKMDLSGSPEDTIEAAAPDDDIFEIELWETGPVFWIRANEFDDIGYFPSLKSARTYAKQEFESFISELADRESEEDVEDSEEEDLAESDAENAWIAQHLRTGTCPICQGPQAHCNHLLADIDLTFGSLDAGSLNDVYVEICELGEKEEPLTALHDFLLDNVDTWYHSDGSEDLGRPMSESRNVWFWSNDVAGIEKAVREWFLPSKPPEKPKKQRRKKPPIERPAADQESLAMGTDAQPMNDIVKEEEQK